MTTRIALGMAALCVALGACGGSSTDPTTIRLAANPWSGSRVDAAVAKILLERELGYRVEIVEVDENAQWPLIASGEIHASMEVWPSGHAENISRYIDELATVEDAGPLGPIGKIGWYVPKYLLDAHPDLATWEGLTDPSNVELFRTEESGANGRFLAGDPTWVQYDADIIRNLGLDFEVTSAGSESALLSEVEAAYARQEPILFYFWVPHVEQARLDLAEVALPPYTPACYAEASAGGIDCDYPADVLTKIAWAGLDEHAPRAARFLRNFNYSTAEQTELLVLVDLDGKTPEQAAEEWIARNPEVWRPWIPEVYPTCSKPTFPHVASNM